MYKLICISTDGETVTEHNVFRNDGLFETIKEAWERNNNMGSRWAFYPVRVVVDEEDSSIAAVCDGMSQEYINAPLDRLTDDIKTGLIDIEAIL